MKSHEYLIKNNIINFVTTDGRKGLKENGPYDVIHVAACVET